MMMITKNNKFSVFSWLLPLITIGMLVGLVACGDGSSGNGAPSATPLTVSHSLVGDDLTVTVALADNATLSDNLVVSVVLTPTGGTAITEMVTLSAGTDNGTATFADLDDGTYSLSATATDAQFTYTGGTAIEVAPLATLGTPSSASIAEAGGTTNVVVSISRAPIAPIAAVTVLVHITPAPVAADYIVSGAGITIGTATGGALPVMVGFDADNLMRTLTITAAEDADGTSESLAIALQDGTGYRIDTTNTTRTVTINDNEPLATLGMPSSTSIAEGASDGSESATVVISLMPAPSAVIDLQLNISPAPDAADYIVSGAGITLGTVINDMLPVTVSLDGTNTTRTLTITAAEDVDGTSESLTLALPAGTGYRIDTANATRTVTINDNNPLASLAAPSRTIIAEGASDGSESATVVVSLSRTPAAAVTLQLNISPAPVASDYTVIGTGIALGMATGDMLPVMVSLDATNMTRTLTISAANDDDDIAEALTIALQTGSGYQIDSSGNVQSLAINDIPLVSCEFRNTAGDTVITSVAESTGAFAITFVLPATIDPNATFVHTSSTLSIHYNVAGGDTNPIVAADLENGFDDNVVATSAGSRGVNFLIADDGQDGAGAPRDETLRVTILPRPSSSTLEYAYRLSATPTCDLTITDSD